MNVIDKDIPSIIVWKALNLNHPKWEDLHGVCPHPEANVVLTVNGVEQPLAETLEEMWRQCTDMLDSKVEAAVIQRTQILDLEPLQAIVEELQRVLVAKANKALDKARAL